MAVNVRLIKLTWENKGVFEMQSKLNDEAWISLQKNTEDGEMVSLWDSIQKVCELYFKKKLNEIGEDMKLP